MRREALQYLVCPVDKGSLELKGDSSSDNVIRGSLYCDTCTSEYRLIEGGIPDFRTPHTSIIGDLNVKLKDYMRDRIWIKDLATPTSTTPAPAEEREKLDDVFYEFLGKTNGPILDFCSGMGTRNSRTFNKLSDAKIVAFDYDHFPLKYQQEKFQKFENSGQLQLLYANAFELPVCNEAFSSLTADIGFNATSDPLKAMQEARRVLKNDGLGVTLLVDVPGKTNYFGDYLNNLELSGFSIEDKEIIPYSDGRKFLITKFRK